MLNRLFRDTLIIFLLSMFVSIIGSVTDGIITGNFLGTEAIAAFGLTLPYQKFIAIFNNVVMVGMQVLCSKHLGKGNLRESNEVFSLAVIVTLDLSLFMACGTILFPEYVADALGATENVGGNIRELTMDFLEAYALGLPAMAAVVLFTPIMQLDSDRQRAVVSAAILSGCNVVGDLINVFVFGGGLWGMAFVTAISYWITAGFLLLHFFKETASFTFLGDVSRLKNLHHLILVGLPVIFGRGSSLLRTAFFTRMSLSFAGGISAAVYAVIENFSGLLEIIPKALGSSTLMIAGEYLCGWKII